MLSMWLLDSLSLGLMRVVGEPSPETRYVYSPVMYAKVLVFQMSCLTL